MADQRNVTLAVTGAGGTRIARFVLEALVKDGTKTPAHRDREER